MELAPDAVDEKSLSPRVQVIVGTDMGYLKGLNGYTMGIYHNVSIWSGIFWTYRNMIG